MTAVAITGPDNGAPLHEARALLLDERRRMGRLGSAPLGKQELATRLAEVLELDPELVLELMRRSGLSTTYRGLTPARIEALLEEAYTHPAYRAPVMMTRDLQPVPELAPDLVTEPSPEMMTADGAEDAHGEDPEPAAAPAPVPEPEPQAGRSAAQMLAAARSTLVDVRTRARGADADSVSMASTVRRLSADLQLSEAHVEKLLYQSGIVYPLATTMNATTIARFVHAAKVAVVRVVGPAPAPVRPASPFQQTPAKTGARRGAATYPACRRLVEGTLGHSTAQVTADIYLAMAELSAYRSTEHAAAIAEIAADRFGIHAEPLTGARIGKQAASAFSNGHGGVMLDQLSRLDRRLRGIFYDAHRDRVTAWDSSDGVMTLYTLDVPALRTRAAAADESGELHLPPVRRQAVGSTYEPKTDDDPALILAMAAYQLGRQAAESLHPAKPRSPEPAPDQDRRSPEPGDARVVGARTWVQPVFGAWGEVSVGEMDASYTRFTAGPRSRKGAQVREHLRRAKGTSADARLTIKVSSHYRHGTGPGASAPTPVVTRVSEKKRLWS